MPLPDVLRSVGLNAEKLKAAPNSKVLNKAQSLGKEDSILKAKLNTQAENTEAVKDILGRRGTGTLLDLPIGLIRALPPVKKRLTDEKYKNLLYSYQSKLIEADRAGGEALAKRNKLLKSLFTETDLLPKVHVETKSGNKIDAFVPTEVSRLSAPVDKTKRLALPILALYGVSSIADSPKKESSAKRTREGDIVVQKVSSVNLDEVKSKLIEKIANTLAALNDNASAKSPSVEMVAQQKILKAAELLKQASVTIENLREQLANEQEDNKRLKLQILAKERSQRAVKLAKEMARKGMIKQAEYDSQVDYIMGLDDEAYGLLQKTVDSVPVKTANTDSNGVDKLSYMLVEDESVNEKPSLAEAILNMKV